MTRPIACIWFCFEIVLCLHSLVHEVMLRQTLMLCIVLHVFMFLTPISAPGLPQMVCMHTAFDARELLNTLETFSQPEGSTQTKP